ncbi:uncharacterized protein GGS22DRAFT_199792 [Annulohypoxylon maeteangense]|uniref:uncharacterized protein n=1 Tax=Annulohypoxylon maeteangense TaxID=1927788 RepID=UPI002008AF9F|nr:uncharacterized protein GGS22DRAFT_199792 [Annulohypoxylon maeteangense]KAI0885491.1 hypothetical protein GGS22DRAFT_199792 [Annulohypoxylon maeteangense]
MDPGSVADAGWTIAVGDLLGRIDVEDVDASWVTPAAAKHFFTPTSAPFSHAISQNAWKLEAHVERDDHSILYGRSSLYRSIYGLSPAASTWVLMVFEISLRDFNPAVSIPRRIPVSSPLSMILRGFTPSMTHIPHSIHLRGKKQTGNELAAPSSRFYWLGTAPKNKYAMEPLRGSSHSSVRRQACGEISAHLAPAKVDKKSFTSPFVRKVRGSSAKRPLAEKAVKLLALPLSPPNFTRRHHEDKEKA